MEVVVALVCAVFVFMSGRNDGAVLVAVNLQGVRRHVGLPLLVLSVAVVTAPLFGISGVAISLESLLGGQSVDAAVASAVVGTVVVVVAVADAVHVPTSLTLALIGALTGSTIARGLDADGWLVFRVIVLGVLAPVVAALVSFGLGRLSLHSFGASPFRVGAIRTGGFALLVAAYATNDGQKIPFAVALGLGISMAGIGDWWPVLVGAAVVFMLGSLAGLRSTGRFVRNGVASTTPLLYLGAELSTAGVVLGGSVLGVPLSLTQSLTGALVGGAAARSRRAVHWSVAGRVLVTWGWTLPAALVLAFVVTRVVGSVWEV